MLIFRIADKINNCLSAGILITIAWIPCNAGIHGNEILLLLRESKD